MNPGPPLPQNTTAVSLAGLNAEPDAPWQGEPKRAISWAASTGAVGLVIDAARAGFRPRELDASARRDLGAALRRQGLVFSGIDLWVPPEHFTSPANADRAFDALRGSCELARALAPESGRGAVVSVMLPDDQSVQTTAAGIAERAGAHIADHSAARFNPDRNEGVHTLRHGLDPAALFAVGMDPIAIAAKHAPSLASARISDLGPMGRVAAGTARLDLGAYRVTLGVAGYAGPLVIDLRGLRNQDVAARELVERLLAPPFA